MATLNYRVATRLQVPFAQRLGAYLHVYRCFGALPEKDEVRSLIADTPLATMTSRAADLIRARPRLGRGTVRDVR
jgi:hypothetical protein